MHRLVDGWPWLAAHPQLIGGSVLVIAGAFQFSSLKDKCLSECRHPAAFLLKKYGRGVGGAFQLGHDHALFCVGCCWALMLVMFAVGIANLIWMAPLALVMFVEKAQAGRDRVVVPVGIGFIVLGLLTLLSPGSVPGVISVS